MKIGLFFGFFSALFLTYPLSASAETCAAEIPPEDIDCYDYNFQPPRYILGLCSSQSAGPYRTRRAFAGPPFSAFCGWEWYFVPCETCPPGWGDWYLRPLGHTEGPVDPDQPVGNPPSEGSDVFFLPAPRPE